MPLKPSDKVIKSVRKGNKLVLIVKQKDGKIKEDVRTSCKCSKDTSKPCQCRPRKKK